MLLYIIRHAEPDYAEIHGSPLTDRGNLQALAAAKRLSVHGLDRIFTSPLKRAKETAKYTCELLGKEAEVVDFLSEHFALDLFGGPLPDGKRYWIFGQKNHEMRTNENLNMKMADAAKAPCLSVIDYDAGFKKLAAEADKFFEERLGYKREGAVYKILKPNNNERVAFSAIRGSVCICLLICLLYRFRYLSAVSTSRILL